MERGASEEPLLVLRRLGRMIGSCSWLLKDRIMMIDYTNAMREVS